VSPEGAPVRRVRVGAGRLPGPDTELMPLPAGAPPVRGTGSRVMM